MDTILKRISEVVFRYDLIYDFLYDFLHDFMYDLLRFYVQCSFYASHDGCTEGRADDCLMLRMMVV